MQKYIKIAGWESTMLVRNRILVIFRGRHSKTGAIFRVVPHATKKVAESVFLIREVACRRGGRGEGVGTG